MTADINRGTDFKVNSHDMIGLLKMVQAMVGLATSTQGPQSPEQGGHWWRDLCRNELND